MPSSWGFYKNLTVGDGEKLLKTNGEHGNYLCRRGTSTPGSYTLSVRRQKEVWHFKINNDGEVFNLYENDGFASVPDLIGYYCAHPEKFIDQNGRSVQLTEPVVSEVVEDDPGLSQEKWFFGEIGRQEADGFLKKRGEHGSYLVRESRSQPGNFVLSVRHHNETIEFLLRYDGNHFYIANTTQSFPTMSHLITNFTDQPLIHKETDKEIYLVEPLCDTAERLRNDQRIKREFEWLQHEDKANTNTKNEGSRPENRGRNRYKNILPFDHTRVVLRGVDPDIVGSDYINASYIFDDESGALFIASQGAVKATVDDFWHMIYQENTMIIIMVTNEVEKAKIKCVRYWPEPGMSMIADNKQVSNVGETMTRDYIVRQLEITETEPGRGQGVRRIFHYQYVGWPDHGVPNDPGSLLEMMQMIESTQKTFEYPGPPVIHCSAGIGRTGTVIVVSMLISLFKIKGHLEERDIPRTVQKVRLQRSGMVQTEAQYRFIYAAIVFYMDTEETKQNVSTQSKQSYDNLDDMSDLMNNLPVQEYEEDNKKMKKKKSKM